MKRSHLIYGIVYTCIGVAFLLLALFTEYRLESLFWGLAGGMGFSGIQMIVRYVYWSAPGRREIYAQRMEQERIELHDELKEKIRDKSGRYAYILGFIIITCAMFVFSILSLLDVIENAEIFVAFLGIYWIIQLVSGRLFFRQLMKKY